MTQSTQAYTYISTVTDKESKGIYLSLFDLTTGQLSTPELVAQISNPGFLATDPENRFLYSTSGGTPTGDMITPVCAVNGFAIDHSNGALTYINGQHIEDTKYSHISTDYATKTLMGADYAKGTIASFPIGDDGSLSPAVSFTAHDGYSMANPKRQESPHLHSINADRSNQYVFVCDFSADEVAVYRLDNETQELTLSSTVKSAPGSGPRHLTTHPNGTWVYAINELAGSITFYTFDTGDGVLTEVQTIGTLPDNFSGDNTSAEIVISPNRQFLYGSNRDISNSGQDTIAYYRIEETGELTLGGQVSTQGIHPRNFTVDPTGQFLLVSNRDTDNVVVFRLDAGTGEPIPTGHEMALAGPMCIKMILKD
ncbi:MAG: lactonase family protein [Chloroflexota bacterium]